MYYTLLLFRMTAVQSIIYNFKDSLKQPMHVVVEKIWITENSFLWCSTHLTEHDMYERPLFSCLTYNDVITIQQCTMQCRKWICWRLIDNAVTTLKLAVTCIWNYKAAICTGTWQLWEDYEHVACPLQSEWAARSLLKYCIFQVATLYIYFGLGQSWRWVVEYVNYVGQ